MLQLKNQYIRVLMGAEPRFLGESQQKIGGAERGEGGSHELEKCRPRCGSCRINYVPRCVCYNGSAGIRRPYTHCDE